MAARAEQGTRRNAPAAKKKAYQEPMARVEKARACRVLTVPAALPRIEAIATLAHLLPAAEVALAENLPHLEEWNLENCQPQHL